MDGISVVQLAKRCIKLIAEVEPSPELDRIIVTALAICIWFGAGALYCYPQVDSGSEESGTTVARTAPHESRPAPLLVPFAALFWAMLVGVSATLNSKAIVVLNTRAPNPELHSLSVTSAVYALTLLPLSISWLHSAPARQPPLLLCCSGVCTVLVFTIGICSGIFGFAATMVSLLVGSLFTALILDYLQTSVLNIRSLVGVALVFLGALQLLFSCSPEVHAYSIQPRAIEFFCLFLVGCTGGGFVLQSRFNQILTKFLGSTFRTAFVCNLVQAFLLGMLAITGGVPLKAQFEDLWLWIFCVAQAVFFTASVTVLPKFISFAALFCSMKSGQLIAAMAFDTIELFAAQHTGALAKTLAVQALGLLLALVGSTICVLPKENETANERDAKNSDQRQ